MICPTIGEMSDVVLGWLDEQPPDTQQEFKDVPFSHLGEYHHTLGRSIRNHFKLWETKWEPELINGVDFSNNHPDSISMRVIEHAWLQLHNS